MNYLTRRDMLRTTLKAGFCLLGVLNLGGCRKQPVVQVERVIEKEVTKIVKELVRETVLVPGTPEIVERTVEVEKVVTSTKGVETTPAPRSRTRLIAHGMSYGWTRFAMQVTPAFEEMFSGITIEWRTLSDWQEYPQRIAALYAAGELGDLVEVPSGPLLAGWARRGILRTLDELIAAYGFDTQGLFRSALNSFTYEDHLYALPFVSHPGTGLLVYNKLLFDAAGEPYPQAQWTLDDLIAAGGKLSRDTDGNGRTDQFGFAVRYNDLDAYPLLHLFGARFLSKDGRACQLGSAEALAYLRWVYDQVHTHKIAPGPAQMVGGPLNMFHGGQVAMLRQTLREFASLRHADEEGTFDAVLFPRHPATGKVAALSSSLGYAISRSALSADDVLQWIKFMSSREMGVQMFLGGYSYPGCRLASWQDPRVVGEYPICAQLAEVADVAENERLPWNLRLADCLAIWNDQMTRLWYDELTPEACVTRIVERVDEVLQQPPEVEGGQVLSDFLLPR